MRNIHKEISDKIVAAMEQGKLPWIKPWSGIGGGAMPRNAVTRRAYSGANVTLLWLASDAGNYTSNRWLTYKQAQEAGGNVKKGEKATMVVYASTFEKENDKGQKNVIPFLKSFSVFALEQCEGLDAFLEKPKALNPDQRDADCDAFLLASGADIRHGEGRAYYKNSEDFIMLPPFEAFKSGTGYYETALHELVHWSGHEKRCNRQFGKRFGDKAYAAEELVAELGAAFMCAEFGYDAVTQHAAYIQNWIDLIKDDPKAFITASSKASASVEYLRGLVLTEERIAA
jgi:antirestriction protein ArdC